jgi:dsRNA-specific ribonuclease
LNEEDQDLRRNFLASLDVLRGRIDSLNHSHLNSRLVYTIPDVIIHLIMQSAARLKCILARATGLKSASATALKNGARKRSSASSRSITITNSFNKPLSRLYTTSYVDKRPNNGKFHVAEQDDEDFDSEMILDSEMPAHIPQSTDTATKEPKFVRPRQNGPAYEYVGKNEAGLKVYRTYGVEGPDAAMKQVETLWSHGGRRFRKKFEKVLVEEPLKDADFDFVTPPNDLYDAPFDFSRLSASSVDLKLLIDVVSKKVGHNLINRKDAVIQAFESVVKNLDVKPMDPALFSIGRELLELHVVNALSSTYPNLPPDGMIALTSQASSPSALSRAFLALELEPFVQIVPSISLSKFPDPSATCLQLAANAYASLIGVIYIDQGYDAASKFIFQTLQISKVTPDELKRLKLLDGVKDAKKSLHKLLWRLRFPLPSYEIEHSQARAVERPGYKSTRFRSVVKSGHMVIGRGEASTKLRAESRAAADALLLHWTQQPSL